MTLADSTVTVARGLLFSGRPVPSAIWLGAIDLRRLQAGGAATLRLWGTEHASPRRDTPRTGCPSPTGRPDRRSGPLLPLRISRERRRHRAHLRQLTSRPPARCPFPAHQYCPRPADLARRTRRLARRRHQPRAAAQPPRRTLVGSRCQRHHRQHRGRGQPQGRAHHRPRRAAYLRHHPHPRRHGA